MCSSIELWALVSIVESRMGRPPLWSRGNIVTSHPAGPGSVPGQNNFLVEVLSWVFPQRKIKCQEIWASFVPGYHMAIIYHPNHISSVYGRRRSLAITVVQTITEWVGNGWSAKGPSSYWQMSPGVVLMTAVPRTNLLYYFNSKKILGKCASEKRNVEIVRQKIKVSNHRTSRLVQNSAVTNHSRLLSVTMETMLSCQTGTLETRWRGDYFVTACSPLTPQLTATILTASPPFHLAT